MTVTPLAATYDLNTTGELHTDIAVTVNSNANAKVSKVMEGTTELTRSTDFTMVGDTVKIKTSYLDTRNVGEVVKINIQTDDGEIGRLEITVIDTTQ